MSQTLGDDIAEIRTLLSEKEQASGTLSKALQKARRRLPRRIFRQGQRLAAALPLLDHPKLSQTLDQGALKAAAQEVSAHLKTIDVAQRRKDWLLDLLGSIAMSLLGVMGLLLLVLYLRGFV